ncbi:sodium-translocating pyrophosphatase [Candidatus Gracilibacteria bacterium]|nr:sodium-translocating pyrophosphatase [Candidatus Gracilibacteria bacterium]MCF7856564.1 sodium-translocating pyrophosphatase [Candidatus Gracilibacteria bacterium]MCF7896888.1 sodium-translocating pyrophosphatase [Candidatus Gracilibacteria bacterium]
MQTILTTLSANIIWVTGGAALLALIFAVAKYFLIMREDAGDAKMQGISKQVQDGAAAFLNTEYKWLAVFVIIVAAAIGFSDAEKGLGIFTATAFVSGAVASALAGYFGMHTATRAAVRTTQAAKKGLAEALGVSFSSGIVMGMSVVGLALLGVATFFYFYTDGGANITPVTIGQIIGFSFGASSIALFSRVGGGIFTKAADVGADLVGKVEAGIPEDDPRNPATIADNVGDNVGDVAGMGADLFESYVGSIVAAMTLAVFTFGGDANMVSAVVLPLAIAGFGIFASIIGTFFVRAKDEKGLHAALNRGLVVASILSIGAAWFLTNQVFVLPEMLSGMNVFYAIVAGIAAGVAVGKITEYYTATENKPVQDIAKQSETGAATNIIHGLATGMESVAAPVLVICLGIFAANYFAGVYGVALAAVGMLSTLGISLGIDAYGPVADNAGGLAEMAQLPEEVRQRTDALDAVGNTTAAIGKGFAIGSAALTALALFAAFSQGASLDGTPLILDINTPEVIIGLLLGGILPFVFSSLTMRAVGNAAFEMVKEVRRQFKEIPGIMEGTTPPDAARCVKISTDGSLKQMILPGAIAIVTPIVVGFWNVQILGGLLAGALVVGVMMAIFMANAGGAWDNAKKFIENGNFGGKGSDAHKASVVGDTVGDPFKDTSGPALNILIKLMTVVSLVFLPWFLG